jgi:hypothetical protein
VSRMKISTRFLRTSEMNFCIQVSVIVFTDYGKSLTIIAVKTSRSNNIFSPSPHQKRQSQVDDVASSLSSPSSRSAKFRKLLSDRQDHKCAITGRMDHTYATEHKAITELSKSTHCEGAHIIPFCFGNFPDTAVRLLAIPFLGINHADIFLGTFQR